MERLSKRREEDRQARVSILEAMKVVLRVGQISHAKEMGQAAKQLNEKIKTHDYSNDKTFEEIWRDKVEAGAKANDIQLPKDYWKNRWG